MQTLCFRATGTQWWLSCDQPLLLPHARALVHDAEQRLSRFIPTSSLSQLNRYRSSPDPMLAAVVRVALRMRERTLGAFDPTLGARLHALGYDRSFDALASYPARAAERYATGALAVTLRGDTVRLHGGGQVDLGGIAKGFIVDRVIELLAASGVTQALVDGGGDIRVLGGPWPIELESGHVVSLSDGAIATSSVRERRWRDVLGAELHHVLDPRTGRPTQSTVDVATVRAPDAATADALATAVLVDPRLASTVLPALGAEAALCDARGEWWTTPHWEHAA